MGPCRKVETREGPVSRWDPCTAIRSISYLTRRHCTPRSRQPCLQKCCEQWTNEKKSTLHQCFWQTWSVCLYETDLSLQHGLCGDNWECFGITYDNSACKCYQQHERLQSSPFLISSQVVRLHDSFLNQAAVYDSTRLWVWGAHRTTSFFACVASVRCFTNGGSWWLFFLSGSPLKQSSSPNQMLGTPIFVSQKWSLGVTPSFLGLMSPIYRFCRLMTSKVGQPIPTCHFTRLTQTWSILFLSINKFGLAEYFLSISATPL